jgi:hypothetical protein
VADVDGSWDCASQTPMGEQKFVLTLASQPGGALTGSVSGAMGSADISDAAVDGNKIRFSMRVTVPMPITLTGEASVEGDALTGTLKAGAFGSFPLQGKRQG